MLRGNADGGSSLTRDWRRLALLVLLAAGVAVYFISLGNSAIWDANEAYYVETPREMLEAHDLINPTFNYLPRFNKPVLSYWIVAGLFKVLGVSVAVQRFGIALGALIIIACAYVLAGVEAARASDLAPRASPLAARVRRFVVGGGGTCRGSTPADVRTSDLHRHLADRFHVADADVLRPE